jgi:predicted membrane metal-binding protein
MKLQNTHKLEKIKKGISIKKIILIAAFVELVSLPLLMLTVGHAGPEGGFAPLGVIPFLINLPSLFLISFLPYTPDSMILNIFLIFIIQMLIIVTLVNFLNWLFTNLQKKNGK